MKAGDRAEKIAAGYLQRKGLALIETRYRCRWGEIDLILKDRDTVVFTEVRLRRSKDFGGAAYSVDSRKQARIIATARHYLAGRKEAACRFDVGSLDRPDPPGVEWIRDAFSAGGLPGFASGSTAVPEPARRVRKEGYGRIRVV